MRNSNYIDSVGKTYNFLTVIEELKNYRVKIRCVCGCEKIRDKYSVTSGVLKSCGCKTLNVAREGIISTMIGKKFGRWTVLSFDSIYNKRYKWKCQCTCGGIKILSNTVLKRGESKSCGCIKNETPFLKNSGETSFNSLFYNYKRSAIKKSKIFDLSKEEFKHITNSDCFYCGEKPSQIISKAHSKKVSVIDHAKYVYNGVDRIDSNLGYVKENIVACCWKCNVSKNNMNIEEFRNRIINMVTYKGMAKCFDKDTNNEIDDTIFIRSGIKSALSAYKRHARNIKVPFELSIYQSYRITQSNCAYCGEEPSNLCRSYVYSGIDRVDNKLGYSIDNVVPCCKRCNISKASMSVEEFKNHNYKIYTNWANR